METLPDEIISIIIKSVPYKESNWLSIRLTCRRFYNIAKIAQDPSINNNKAIIHASRNGYLHLFEELIKDKRVDPFAQNDKALDEAIIYGHEDIILTFFNMKNDFYLSGIKSACRRSCLRYGLVGVFKYLVDRNHIDLDDHWIVDECIQNTITKGHGELLRFLMGIPFRTNEHRIYALHSAINDKKLDMLKIVLTNKFLTGIECMNAMKLAVKQGDYVDIINLLINDERVKKDSNLIDCLILSIERNHIKTCRLLSNHKKVEIQYNKNHCFRIACLYGRYELVIEMLKNKNVNPSDHDNAALKAASKNGHDKVVSILLKHNKVDPSSGQCESLIKACRHGHTNTVAILLKDERVDPTVKKNKPLRVAFSRGHVDIVKILLDDKRVDPYDKDDYVFKISKNQSIVLRNLLSEYEQKNPRKKTKYE